MGRAGSQAGASLQEQMNVRRAKLEQLQGIGLNPFQCNSYPITHYSNQLTQNYEAYEGNTVSLAGRIMSMRIMGKASFCHIRDGCGSIQLHLRRDEMDVESYNRFKKYDLGDIVGVTGTLFKTQTGEVTVRVSEITLLSKALRPMPEKVHGLQDPELRFRNRHLDLISSDTVRNNFVVRARFMRYMREYLDNLGFIEVETPVLQASAGGAAARPFITHHNALDIDMSLRIATELYLKRLIIGGMDRVYEIGRIFRNEGMDHRHNPEFTSIELYQAYTDFHGMMDIAEQMLSGAVYDITGSYVIHWLGHEANLEPHWARMTMVEAVHKFTGVDFQNLSDVDAIEAAKGLGVAVKGGMEATWGNVLFEVFDQLVEKNLIQPTFITHYPVEVSPLAKRSAEDSRVVERFEFFICGCEMGNAYTELNDPIDQRQRFERQAKLREQSGDDEVEVLDSDFVEAMEYGMPPTGGMGMGIDRIVMMLTGNDNIREVILFPTMRPL